MLRNQEQEAAERGFLMKRVLLVQVGSRECPGNAGQHVRVLVDLDVGPDASAANREVAERIQVSV